MDSNHWQRIFAYLTGALVIGLLLIVFTNSFLSYVSAEGSTGHITLLAYGFIFLNLGYGVNRRFALKSERMPAVHFTLSLFMLAPTLFWIYTKDEGLGELRFTFTLTIIFAVFLGTYFGIRRGRKKQKQYLRKIREEAEGQTPEEMKRPHDDLSRN